MATTASLIQWLAAGVRTTAGVAVASGNVRFYLPSTLTPQTVYSDAAAASAITPPLVLSAGGTGTVYTVNAVRMIVKDALDVTTLWDVTLNVGRDDLIYVTSPAFNGGTETRLDTIIDAVSTSLGGTAGYWKGLVGTSERNIKDMISDIAINLKDYGAVGDGSTNDTTAVQNAVTAASAKRLIAPAGTYLISSAITLPAGGVIVEGAGNQVSIFKQSSTTANGFTASSGTQEFRNLGIIASTSSTGAAIAGTALIVRNVNVPSAYWRTAVSSTGQTVISDCVLGGADDASSKVITTSGVTLITNTRINPNNASAIGIEFTGSSNGLVMAACMVGIPTGALTGTGVKISSSGTVMIAGGHIAGAPALHLTSAATGTIDVGTPLIGNVTDARTAEPRQFVLAGAASVTPSVGNFFKIKQTAAGAVTVNVPTYTADFGRPLIVSCSNASGGAVTFTFAAGYKTSAAVAPADTTRLTLMFYYDPVDSKWSEVCRSAAVAN